MIVDVVGLDYLLVVIGDMCDGGCGGKVLGKFSPCRSIALASYHMHL